MYTMHSLIHDPYTFMAFQEQPQLMHMPPTHPPDPPLDTLSTLSTLSHDKNVLLEELGILCGNSAYRRQITMYYNLVHEGKPYDNIQVLQSLVVYGKRLIHHPKPQVPSFPSPLDALKPDDLHIDGIGELLPHVIPLIEVDPVNETIL